MSRIVIQIPCLNEECILPQTIASIRAATAEMPDVLILIVDDGSSDGTIEAARRCGADYVAKLRAHRGLARAFVAGLRASLRLGADIIVNTDADNQYVAADIPKLIEPIVNGRADILVGARPVSTIEHFSWLKRQLQRLGTATIRWLSSTNVQDATSGFRAISREAALQLNVFTRFTYTLETLIQAGRNGLRVMSVPVRVHPPTRPSRLFRSNMQYVSQSIVHILRVYTIYEPLRTYAALGMVPFVAGCLLFLRYIGLVLFVDPARAHAPSLLLATTFFSLAFTLWAVGVVGDLIAANRQLLEDIQIEQRRALLRYESPFDLDHGFELLSLKENREGMLNGK
jgi:glycosyltransferase involved in cell wall biosynthesis